MNSAQTYDDLSEHYHLMFEDWNASIERQASVLSSILQKNCGLAKSARVLDCTCGIGTQALGLAKLGFQVSGCDISSNAIKRAQQEAAQRHLDIQFSVGNILALNDFQGPPFDAVICMDNSLPHLESAEQLAQTTQQMRAKLNLKGVLMASIRDYDRLLMEKPIIQGPSFYGTQGSRRIVFQLWDWIDDRRYVFHLYVTRETESGWQTFHTSGIYRAVLREEISSALRDADFSNVRWLFPEESGFYQPIVLGVAN
jgi:SAM-dependent methyltransferase